MSVTKIKIISLALLIFFTQLIAGCEQKNPVSEYGDALISAYEKGKRGGEEANLKSIKDTIQTYYAANGKYPETIKEIEGLLGSPINADFYQYNPETGEIHLKK